MTKASFDVCIAPMTNITLEVNDPGNLTDEEIEKLVNEARERILTSGDDYICLENLESIERYDKETGRKTPIYTVDMLRLTEEQVINLKAVFGNYKEHNAKFPRALKRAEELEKFFHQVTGGKYNP